MSKRELAMLGSTVDLEGSRLKRRRDVVTAMSSPDVDVTKPEPVKLEGGEGRTGVSSEDAEVIKQQGLGLWQTVKDAVNKDGRILSLEFLRKPPKRLYPDYYQLIKHPIALDDIKKQLELGGYFSLDAIRKDFELCFNNAKEYNMKDSTIWLDAKDLLRVVRKAFHKFSPQDEDGEDGDGDEEKSKSKSPNLNRLIKSRLQKLVDKADSSGRVLSQEFMDLPSKKDWPLYYKEIKKPQCLENIFKRIKRKEYLDAAEFAADVELVFSNAIAFNQDHTPIWEDAMTLRDTFRHLMSDLPPPFTLPEYATHITKIKIKPQTTTVSAPSINAARPAESLPSSSLLLRMRPSHAHPPAAVPAPSAVKQSPKPTAPKPLPKSPSISKVTPVPIPKQAASSTPAQMATTSQPTGSAPSFMSTPFPHYPNAAYTPPLSGPTSSDPPTTASSVINRFMTPKLGMDSASGSPAPAPPAPLEHQLKRLSLEIRPRGRTLNLDHRDGVTVWAMRLAPGETSIVVRDVVFVDRHGEENEDDDKVVDEDEEEDEEDDVTKKGRSKKGKSRGAKVKVVAKVKQPPKKKKKSREVNVKLNGSAVKQETESTGPHWTADLVAGSNVLEIGESGGTTWKTFVERLPNS